ncbi:ABC transporter permease [Nitratidesulfovibrio sp. SRB-5]|uniref:ABC transporter permease n=1 Tax=Nitratidesulfovibrio sp. SRB-5 TaxID=2872636 RepID=UPI0010257ED2|nr:ABC transporter permease [Nitratidesulfovibrio sp. SRB-5]MBZ2173226.1 ABC transporter permease [Nitratidesulfovibrio sp. SRB-5]RXF75841.1 antibiotic ABC transporter permease [Desulfovibrio sp. DS-1]
MHDRTTASPPARTSGQPDRYDRHSAQSGPLALLHRLLALIAKEFLTLLKDPKSRTVVILPPLLQTIIFGYAATFDLVDVPCAIYDEDRSAASRELAARVAGSPTFRVVEYLHRDADMARLLDAGQVRLVLRIGQGFERALTLRGGVGQPVAADAGSGGDSSGTAATSTVPAPAPSVAPSQAVVQAIADGRNSNTAGLALNYMASIVDDYGARYVAAHGGQPRPSTLLTRAWHNPNLLSRWFFVPGIVVMVTMVVTLIITALSVAREREQGTFDQMLVTPYRPTELLIGKAAPGFLVGLFEASLIVAMAVFWFGVPLRGSLLTLYAGLVLFLFSVVGIGLMISSLSVTMQQGLLGMFLFTMPAAILSGFATPIANMAEPVQWLTLVNPMRYILIVVRGVFLEGADLTLLAPQLWPLALIGAVCMAAAGWLFRHRIQ